MVVFIGAEEHSWGDVNKIKSGKRSAIISIVSEKNSIVYTYACIELYGIEQYRLDKNINDHCSSHNWNEDDDAFDQQLKKWGEEKLFSYKLEPVTREPRAYIEDNKKP